jgi:cell division protein FtsQ
MSDLDIEQWMKEKEEGSFSSADFLHQALSEQESQSSSDPELEPTESKERRGVPSHLDQESPYFRKLIWIGACFITWLAYDALTTLPYFQVTEVVFKNTKKLKRQELIEYLKFDENTSNFFLLDTEAITEKLNQHPWILFAEVERGFPNQMTVKVIERKIAGVATLDQLTAIDEYGAPIAPLSAQEAMGVPMISGISPKLFTQKGQAHIGQQLLARGLNVARLYEESPLSTLRALSEVYVSETGRIELMLNRTRVSMGQGKLEIMLRDLERILRHLKRKGVDAKYILMSEDHTRAIVQEIPIQLEAMESFKANTSKKP